MIGHNNANSSLANQTLSIRKQHSRFFLVEGFGFQDYVKLRFAAALNITVRVDTDVATPMAGSTYSLTCTVTGAEGLTGSTTTYQWFKDGVMVSGQTMETFSFTSLSFSDAGGYTCQATIMSNLLSGPITTTSSNSVDVTLTCESSFTTSTHLYVHLLINYSTNTNCHCHQ